MSTHTNEKLFKCEHCGSEYKQSSSFNKHTELCQIVHSNKELVNKEDRIRKIKETCIYLYSDKMDGSCHVDSNIDKKVVNKKIMNLQTRFKSGKTVENICNVCNKSFIGNARGHANEHAQIHNERLHFFCIDCDFTAKSIRGHKRRMRTKPTERNESLLFEETNIEQINITSPHPAEDYGKAA